MNNNLSTTLIKSQRIRDYVAANPGSSLTEIAAAVKMNKTTTYRLLMTLVSIDWLVKATGKYYLRGQIQGDYRPVGWLASQVVQPLVDRYQLSVFLGMEYNQELVISQVFASRDHLADFTALGERQSLNASALGKCLLAFMDEPTREAILASTKWQAQTKHSLTDRQSLLYSLKAIHQQGYALDDEEVHLHQRCLAVPVYSQQQQLVATLGLAGSNLVLKRRQIKKIAHDLDVVSRQLTTQIF